MSDLCHNMASTQTKRKKERQSSQITLEIKSKKRELHEKLEEHDLHKIHAAFESREPKSMDRESLRNIIADIAQITFEDDEFEILFLKINAGRNGLVTWDEFVSYLLLCFQQMDIVAEYRSLELPIEGIPRMLRSNHRHPVNRITYYPTVRPDRTTTWKDGSIMTCSKDGVINYWSLDLQVERTVQSTCPELKVQQTWVTDLCVLPDVSVICTSSTERDLRFYDTSARKFELRVMISSLESAVNTMHYVFSQNIEEKSQLIAGDMGGNIRVILFPSFGRGPFKSQPGIPLLHVCYEKVLKGLVPGFQIVEFKNVHTDWVRQVSFYTTLHCIVSCSDCVKAPLVMKDLTEKRINTVFKIKQGIWCFAVAEGVHLIATGGPDCLVRVWNPFVVRRPIVTFTGHHAGVVALIFQDKGQKLASLSKDKCIKVWDVTAQICLQTYLGLPAELGERTGLSLLYNPESREIIIGSIVIAVVHLCKLQSDEHTDGNTHSAGVSVVLYNKLFNVVATCGLDSYIIIWDPWDGRRMNVIKNGHTKLIHGEYVPIEITAATFDPDNQLLLTGAHDGSLKIWNFNTGVCYRNMRIEKNCEVTAVIWIKGRILAIGWNRHITEFNDTGIATGPGGAFSKNWAPNHDEDVLSAAVRVPQALVTSTFSGEIIMWQLETGQAYKRYNVANPEKRIKLEYKPISKKKQQIAHPQMGQPGQQQISTQTAARRRQSGAGKAMGLTPSKPAVPPVSAGPKFLSPAARARKVSMVVMPASCDLPRGLAVHCLLFLCTRPMRPDCGTLLASLENGTIQVWSHHVAGGYITSFSAHHKAGDYVISMITDSQNEFLFTGTTVGYIKIWLMKDYCTFENVKICMPYYRLIFPFLWKDTYFMGRAKRVVRAQPKPTLLSSFKGHTMPISGLTYLEDAKIIVSCSADSSARMWTLGGRYIQTVGTFKSWKTLQVDEIPPEDFDFSLPPDIRRIASSTTMRVLRGGKVPNKLTKKQKEQAEKENLRVTDYSKNIYGQPLSEPILGNYYKLPRREVHRHDFQLDTSCAYIPVYQHLIMPPPQEFERPETPPQIEQIRIMEKAKITKKPSVSSRTSFASYISQKSRRSIASSVAYREKNK